jgi:carbohydrate kinase (thermoresistant glucokinase family)
MAEAVTPQPAPPMAIVVIGVAGSGKTTVGALLAGRLQWEFADADSFHSKANIEKMHAGIPLTDEDRWPWLEAMAAWIDTERQQRRHAVLACSALKRSYRAVLLGAHADVCFVYLRGAEDLIARRITARHGHFMPPSLLHSQFDALEEPGPEEPAIVVSIEARPQDIVAEIIAKLGL